MLKQLSTYSFLLLTFFASSQIEEVRRITETLCSEEFHGRGYYERGDSIAAAFLAEEFEKIGVNPYKKQEYLQRFTIQGINSFNGAMDVMHNGDSLVPGVHFMIDPESSGVKGELMPVVLDGAKLISTENSSGFNEEYLQEKAKELALHNKNCLLFDLSALSADSARMLAGLSKALVNEVPVIEVVSSKFTWSVGRKQLPNPLIYIQDSTYVEGQSFECTIDAEYIERYPSQNVIAYLPAKKKCAETIVFTAHYDHLGRMGLETYFPGANDNASGTAMLITMAKYFLKNPSKYNIMFIAFAGEEAGLLGSEYYVAQPYEKLKKIKFLLNLDIMGSGEEGITAVNATLFEDEFELLQKINEEKDLLAKIKKRGPASNSDHYWFTEKGVPAFFIYTMGPNKNYHDVFDTYDELSFVEYEDITELLVTFVEGLPKK